MNESCLLGLAEKELALKAEEIHKLRLELERLRRENQKLKSPPLKGTSIQKLRVAFKRAVACHGHYYQCSAVRGMEHDCNCGWIEVKALVGL